MTAEIFLCVFISMKLIEQDIFDLAKVVHIKRSEFPSEKNKNTPVKFFFITQTELKESKSLKFLR